MNMNNLTPAEMVRAVDNNPSATENERALAEALDKQLKEIARLKNQKPFVPRFPGANYD